MDIPIIIINYNSILAGASSVIVFAIFYISAQKSGQKIPENSLGDPQNLDSKSLIV